MDKKELKEAIEAGKKYGSFLGGDEKNVIYYEIPWNVMRKYYFNLLVLVYLPYILAFLVFPIALVIVGFAWFGLRFDTFVGVLLLVFILAAEAFASLVILSIFELTLMYFFPPYNEYILSPINKLALENIKCPACNAKIKDWVYKYKFPFSRWIVYRFEAQCGNCKRKFLFQKRYNSLVLIDEVKGTDTS